VNVLFVCSGNTCRSPLAAMMARRAAERPGIMDFHVRSAGVYAAEGEPASEGALLLARERGLDLRRHRSRRLTPELISWADLVVGMTQSHLHAVQASEAAPRCALATEFLPAGHPACGKPVPDPIGGGWAAYSGTFDLLRECVDALCEELLPPTDS